jgi:prepilin-type N-terminal cleavage/methylation domain-containing protein
MMFNRPKSAFSNQRGFTLVELLMVTGILGMLAAIAVQQITVSRTKSFDSQAHTMMRNVLTVAAIDTPQGGDTSGVGGSLVGAGFPDVEFPANVYWTVDNDGADRWRFYFAHPAGLMGYYFWVPGDTYSGPLDTDGSGNRSDKIFSDKSVGSYRNLANGSLP